MAWAAPAVSAVTVHPWLTICGLHGCLQIEGEIAALKQDGFRAPVQSMPQICEVRAACMCCIALQLCAGSRGIPGASASSCSMCKDLMCRLDAAARPLNCSPSAGLAEGCPRPPHCGGMPQDQPPAGWLGQAAGAAPVHQVLQVHFLAGCCVL